MLAEYKTVYKGGEGEITEKKSRFIATVFPAESEEEAQRFIEEMRKKYWDATHNCFAYVLGERGELQRYSDDGEPGGTAGKPMLDVLLGEEIHNAVLVVSRYFGGTLLGTGGLVRAYASAAKKGLASSRIITKIWGIKLSVTTDYAGFGKIQYLLGSRNLKIQDCVYTDKVNMHVLVPERLVAEVKAQIQETTGGQAGMEEGMACYFAEIDGKIEIFE